MIRVHVTLSSRRPASRRSKVATLAVVLAALPVIALASPVPSLTSFSSGDPILAADFNDNFDAIAAAVDDNDGRISALEGSADGGVPAGAVVFFDAEECPVGWTELPEARGRAIVGMNGTAATLLGTVGDGLEDLGNPSHGHTTDIGAFTSATASVAHTHGVPSQTTGSSGSHNHQWRDGASITYNEGGTPAIVGAPFPAGVGTGITIFNWASNDLYTANDGAHTHSVGASTTGAATSTAHGHSVDPPATASSGVSTSEIMPYVQLLACRRDR